MLAAIKHKRAETIAKTTSADNEGKVYINKPTVDEPNAEAMKSVALCSDAATPETERKALKELFIPTGAIIPKTEAKIPEIMRKGHNPPIQPNAIAINRTATKLADRAPTR